MEAIEEFGMLFRLGSKKYFDRYYLEQKRRLRNENKKESVRKARQIEPFVVYLRSLRVRAGLSQQELASNMATKQSAISRFENGMTSPTLSFLLRYASFVNAKIDIRIISKQK